MNILVLSTFKKYLIILFTLSITSALPAQDFYLDAYGNLVKLKLPINSEWASLNLKDASAFLKSEGFINISSNSLGENGTIIGGVYYDGGRDYVYNRTIMFENNTVTGYVDQVIFLTPSMECFYGDLNLEAFDRTDGRKKDEKERERVLSEFYKVCQSSGMDMNSLNGTKSLGYYDLNISRINNDIKTILTCSVELAGNKFNQYSLSKWTLIDIMPIYVGNYDLRKIDTYDLKLMIDIFLKDCELNGIKINKNVIDVSFDKLEGSVVGLSYGKGNDGLIKIRIDPENWYYCSEPKRWYLLYHELGHDVLNLEHGNGGKMMFNFIDRGYTWSEFVNDKKYMLNAN